MKKNRINKILIVSGDLFVYISGGFGILVIIRLITQYNEATYIDIPALLVIIYTLIVWPKIKDNLREKNKMKTRIQIRTPKGHAKKTERKLRPFLLGFHKCTNIVHSNKADDCIIWVVEGDPRTICKISRNVARFDSIVQNLFNNKMVHGAVQKLKKDDQIQLKQMLINQTSVEIIKDAEFQELIKDKKTIWQKVKERLGR